MTIPVPWLGEDKGRNPFMHKLLAGFSPIVNEIFQIVLMNVTNFIIMIAGCYHSDIFSGFFAEITIEPVKNRIVEWAGGNDSYHGNPGEVFKTLHCAGNWPEVYRNRIGEDIGKYLLYLLERDIQTIFQFEIGYVFLGERTMTVFRAGKTDKCFGGIGNDSVEIEA